MLTEASRSQPKAPSELTYLVCVYVFIVLHIHCTLAQKANLCELSTLPYISYIKGVSQASAAQQSRVKDRLLFQDVICCIKLKKKRVQTPLCCYLVESGCLLSFLY